MIELFKKDVRGATRVWRAFKTEAGFNTESGILGGEMRGDIFEIEYGLANRTRDEQINLRMESKANKKRSGGYVENIENIGGNLKNQMGLERQMKAKLLRDGDVPNCVFDKNAFVQRKYNGHRCTIAKVKGIVLAYSSGGKPITSINHILQGIRIKKNQKLDGELYIHGLSLQKISSLVRKKEIQCPDMKFICFDQMSGKPFIDRFKRIRKQKSKHIVMAETFSVNSFEEVGDLFHRFRGEKYEGAMLRHGNYGYEYGRRSKWMYKIKKLDGIGYYDDEFEVIRIIASAEGWARLVCKTENNKKFTVSCHGTHYEKTEVLENKENYIGKFVTIEYPEWTDGGKPAQPVALRWREKDE